MEILENLVEELQRNSIHKTLIESYEKLEEVGMNDKSSQVCVRNM